MPFKRPFIRRKRPHRRSRALTTYARRNPIFQTGNARPSGFGRQLRTLQPNKMKVVLRFAYNSGDVHPITSSSGSVVDWTYRANGMYDPFYGTGGNQPRGFDQYMALYRNFTVIGSKCHVRFMFKDNNASTGTNYFMKVGITLRDGGTALSTTNEVAEAARSDLKVITSSDSVVRCSKTFSARKFFSKPSVLTDDALAGTATADPTEQAYFHIVGYALNSETATCYFDGWIDYIAILTSPIMPSQS